MEHTPAAGGSRGVIQYGQIAIETREFRRPVKAVVYPEAKLLLVHDGFSVPAQREANLRQAKELNAVVAEKFVDAGESARKADRPELMRTIEYVKANQVSYCIIHKVNRLARNRVDDVTIHLALKEA